jgi:hypothetical protein
MSELKILSTTKTDAEVAKELRSEFIDAMQPVLALMDRANQHDMLIMFRVGTNQYGKNVLNELNIARHF